MGEASSQRHNLRLPGAVNQRAWLRPPSYWDSDRPESSRCLARALACNESAKQTTRLRERADASVRRPGLGARLLATLDEARAGYDNSGKGSFYLTINT